MQPLLSEIADIGGGNPHSPIEGDVSALGFLAREMFDHPEMLSHFVGVVPGIRRQGAGKDAHGLSHPSFAHDDERMAVLGHDLAWERDEPHGTSFGGWKFKVIET
jgi:hypothetical protein